jgi:death-on-curing family protein
MRSRRTIACSRCTVTRWGCATMELLKSALARPQPPFAYAPGIVDMAAAYTWGIVRKHPFVDGNKRTGFVVGILFLELNGYRFSASGEDNAAGPEVAWDLCKQLVAKH